MEDEEFMGYNTASHQGAIHIFWLHFWWSCYVVHLYLQSAELDRHPADAKLDELKPEPQNKLVRGSEGSSKPEEEQLHHSSEEKGSI